MAADSAFCPKERSGSSSVLSLKKRSRPSWPVSFKASFLICPLAQPTPTDFIHENDHKGRQVAIGAGDSASRHVPSVGPRQRIRVIRNHHYRPSRRHCRSSKNPPSRCYSAGGKNLPVTPPGISIDGSSCALPVRAHARTGKPHVYGLYFGTSCRGCGTLDSR